MSHIYWLASFEGVCIDTVHGGAGGERYIAAVLDKPQRPIALASGQQDFPRTTYGKKKGSLKA